MKMDEKQPKVSIVLPTYNGSKYIRQSIDSCLNQTYKNIELIIVDDCSIDETPEIIKSYKDERIKYIRHEKNMGLPHALNTGFTEAIGEYLTWTSDDNYYTDDAIEKMISFLNSMNGSFIYCDYYVLNYINKMNLQPIRRLPDPKMLKDHNCIGACFLYSKEIKEKIGCYDTDTFLAEDYDYWIRVSKKFTMLHSNEPLYYFRVHENSLYNSRYYDVKTVDFLVRIKNNIAEIKQVTYLFIDLIVEKNINSSPESLKIAFRLIKKIKLLWVYKLLITMIYRKKINELIDDFKMKKINFKTAKICLRNIIGD